MKVQRRLLLLLLCLIVSTGQIVLAQNPTENVELDNPVPTDIQSNGNGQFTLLSPSYYYSCNKGSVTNYAIEFQLTQAPTNGDQIRVGLLPGDFTTYSSNPNADLLYSFHIEYNNYSFYRPGSGWINWSPMTYNNSPIFKIAVNGGNVSFYVDGTSIHTEALAGSISATQLKLGVTVGAIATSGGLPITMLASAAANCSGGPSCSITDAGATVTCLNNNTPNDPSDDLFTISLNPTGSNLGSTYDVSGDITTNNNSYGSATVIGGSFTISGGSKTVTIQDGVDANCTFQVTIAPPSPCSSAPPACSITDAGATVECLDNGTPNDPSDDRFKISLNPTGSNLGSNYSVSGDLSASGVAYGSSTTIGGSFPISGGGKSITITDAGDPTCQFTMVVNAPSPCSSSTPTNGGPFDWENISSTPITENNGVYTGTNWSTALISCNEIDGTSGWAEITLDQLPTGTYHFRFGLTEATTAFSGWTGFDYSMGFESGQGGVHLFGDNASWEGFISNGLQNGNTLQIETTPTQVNFYLNGVYKDQIAKHHTASTLRASLIIATNSGAGAALSFSASESCGPTQLNCSSASTGTFLYPGSLMFVAFDNEVVDESDIVALVARTNIEPGTKFIISNARYEEGRWFAPHGNRDGRIAAQEILYTGSQNIQAGSSISFELPASGSGASLLATNFRVDQINSTDFCVTNVGNTDDPLVNISTTADADALFVMQGYWTFNDLYGRFAGNVISGIIDGGLWESIPSDIECFAIQAYSTPGSHCPFYDNSGSTDLGLDAISDFSLWSSNGCSNSDDLTPTPYRESGEQIEDLEVINDIPQLRTYPNPFYQETTIEYSLPEWVDAQIQVFDATGRLMTTVVPSKLHARGIHKVTLNSSGWGAGIYTVLLRCDKETLIDRVTLINE